MKVSLVVLFLLSVLVFPAYALDVFEQDGVDKIVSSIALHYDGIENKVFRKVVRCNICESDLRDEIVVLFDLIHIDGGNFDVQFLAVLSDQVGVENHFKPIFFAEVGGKGVRSFSDLIIENHSVVLIGKENVESDRPNFPSKLMKFRLLSSDGIIVLNKM